MSTPPLTQAASSRVVQYQPQSEHHDHHVDTTTVLQQHQVTHHVLQQPSAAPAVRRAASPPIRTTSATTAEATESAEVARARAAEEAIAQYERLVSTAEAAHAASLTATQGVFQPTQSLTDLATYYSFRFAGSNGRAFAALPVAHKAQAIESFARIAYECFNHTDNDSQYGNLSPYLQAMVVLGAVLANQRDGSSTDNLVDLLLTPNRNAILIALKTLLTGTSPFTLTAATQIAVLNETRRYCERSLEVSRARLVNGNSAEALARFHTTFIPLFTRLEAATQALLANPEASARERLLTAELNAINALVDSVISQPGGATAPAAPPLSSELQVLLGREDQVYNTNRVRREEAYNNFGVTPLGFTVGPVRAVDGLFQVLYHAVASLVATLRIFANKGTDEATTALRQVLTHYRNRNLQVIQAGAKNILLGVITTVPILGAITLYMWLHLPGRAATQPQPLAVTVTLQPQPLPLALTLTPPAAPQDPDTVSHASEEDQPGNARGQSSDSWGTHHDHHDARAVRRSLFHTPNNHPSSAAVSFSHLHFPPRPATTASYPHGTRPQTLEEDLVLRRNAPSAAVAEEGELVGGGGGRNRSPTPPPVRFDG